MVRLPRRPSPRARPARVTAGLACALLVAPPAWAEAALRLSDGTVLEGTGVRRDADLYLLEVEGGSVIPVPAELVGEVRIGEDEDGERRAPSGVRETEPEVLAGVPVEPPRTSDQLAAFGEPAQFQPDVVKSNLGPSYWTMDPSQHNFNPSRWAQAPTDPTWTPESAFDAEKDVLAPSRSTWPKSITDLTWQPTDGFAKKK